MDVAGTALPPACTSVAARSPLSRCACSAKFRADSRTSAMSSSRGRAARAAISWERASGEAYRGRSSRRSPSR